MASNKASDHVPHNNKNDREPPRGIYPRNTLSLLKRHKPLSKGGDGDGLGHLAALFQIFEGHVKRQIITLLILRAIRRQL
jgi:hypothetical protein